VKSVRGIGRNVIADSGLAGDGGASARNGKSKPSRKR